MPFEHLASTLALVGLVILAASLLSGAVERTGLPLVAIFLALGTALGPAGLGVVELGLDSPALQVLTTIGLVLVLFTDAIAVDLAEVRRHRRLALLVLGPGTMIPAGLIALAGWLLLDLHPLAAAIVGAALASTDPVLLRSLLRRPTLPPDSKLALRLESGMNDVVLLPVVVLSMLALGSAETGGMDHLGRHIVGMFLLGPALGGIAGYVAITLLDGVRRRSGVRRDYESLYALGVAFTAYALAEAVGGSGFLAAFAAGLTIAALDVELCDCFVDYGEATAEVFLLFTFVAFGASLIWRGLTVVSVPTLLFAAVALGVRTLVLLPVLRRAGIERRSAWLIAWFGPRGLSSLLLILLPVFAGVRGAEQWFAIVCLVVLISVVVHGVAIAVFLRGSQGTKDMADTQPPEGGAVDVSAGARVETGAQAANLQAGTPIPERITLDELRRIRAAGEPIVVADVRTSRSYGADNLRAEGAVRLSPDDAPGEARRRRLPRDVPLVLYCT
jgi:NhaP-type Na+/H+ or K+/H+ antiporter